MRFHHSGLFSTGPFPTAEISAQQAGRAASILLPCTEDRDTIPKAAFSPEPLCKPPMRSPFPSKCRTNGCLPYDCSRGTRARFPGSADIEYASNTDSAHPGSAPRPFPAHRRAAEKTPP